MECLGNGADTLQGTPQERSEISNAAHTRRSRSFKRGLVAARDDPRFIRYPRSIRAERRIVSAKFDDAQTLAFLLRQNIAEHATLFALVIIARSPKFVEH